jgi:Uncharacterized protein conserved in bacteria (DUF2255)
MRHRGSFAAAVLCLALVGCVDPSDRRPGTRLSGDVAALPPDWTLSAAHQEIAVEVSGFLGLPHSVTIWCATLDGALFIGARDPESKRWPAWADADPNVRLKIGESVYEVRLTKLDDAATIERLQAEFAAKYHLPAPEPGASPPPPSRYWSVGPRS